MRAEVKRSFLDLIEGKDREVGEVFELSEERFAEISRKLNGYIVEAPEGAPADPDPGTGAEGDSTGGDEGGSSEEPTADPEPEEGSSDDSAPDAKVEDE